MVVTLGQQYNVGQKPTVILYLASIAVVVSHIQRMPTRKKLLLYTVVNPARGLLNREIVYNNSSSHALPVAYSFLCMVNTFSRV